MEHPTELEKLRGRLRLLRLLYAASDTHTDTNERFLVHQSLDAVIDFINAQPGWRDLDFAFVKMMVALNNIENGRTVGWLSNPAPNRPAVAIEAAVLRGRLAALMELYMRSGCKRRQAAETILKQIPMDSPAFEGVTAPNWRTIARWRDNVIGNAEPSPERDSYEAMLALAERIG